MRRMSSDSPRCGSFRIPSAGLLVLRMKAMRFLPRCAGERDRMKFLGYFELSGEISMSRYGCSAEKCRWASAGWLPGLFTNGVRVIGGSCKWTLLN